MRTTSLILLCAFLVSPCVAHVKQTVPSTRDGLLTSSTAVVNHDSRFVPMQSECSAFQPPRIVAGRGTGISDKTTRTVIVDFIVLKNGSVEHPFIVEGVEPSINQKVLETVTNWRYRPAMCDGQPSEAEGRIEVTIGDALLSQAPSN